MNYQKHQTGFLLLELMLFLALTATLLAVILPLVFNNQLLIVDSQNRRSGLALVTLLSQNTAQLGFNGLLAPDAKAGVFDLRQDLTWLADYAQSVSSQAVYKIGGSVKKVELNNLLIDQSSNLGRDTCNLFFSANWTDPKLKGSASLSSLNPATAIDVKNNLAYVSSNSPVQSQPDLTLFDVSNLNAPTIIGQINTGPGINAVHLAGEYVFAANDGISDQLEIIKISNLSNPGPVIKIKVPNFNGLSSDGKGSSIFYYQNKIFLGLTKNNGPELHVYNVSNPQFPVWLGAFETNTGVNGIYVFNNVAYLALADGKLLNVLDVNNPSAIFELGSFSPTGSTSQSGQSIAGLGDNIFLGRAGGLPALGYKELYVTNKNNISSPIASFDLNSSVRKIFVRNGLLFLATGDTTKEFQTFSFTNNSLSFLSGLDLTSSATSLDCEGGNIFVTQEDGKMQIISPN
jgi:hypothetical protein